MKLDESSVERALIQWLAGDLGWEYIPGPVLAPDGSRSKRTSWEDIVLVGRLRAALTRLNPQLASAALDDAFRKVLHPQGTTLLARHRAFHKMVRDGVQVEYVEHGGRVRGDTARLVDVDNPGANDWLATNQFTIALRAGPVSNRRADVILFVNGLPLVLIELKNPLSASASLLTAYNQLQTYREQIPDLFVYNELLVVSDGAEAKMGTLTSPFVRFAPWKTIDGTTELSGSNQLETLARGSLARERLLDVISGFTIFEDTGGEPEKKVAAYHQYWAVHKAVEATDQAAASTGDGRAGVIWHTQGSGKSLSMLFYVGQLMRDSRLHNPTIVVLTDRNDLDDQLFGVFASVPDMIPNPERAGESDDLEALLRRASGGIVFTTIQKFRKDQRTKYPFSTRRNIVVIADEAHRSQYELKDGLAYNLRLALPNATFIGFTGTPIESDDRITRNVFGDYIDVYDVKQSVEDGATVPIYYEGRLAEIDLDPKFRPRIDPDFDEVTEGEEDSAKHRLESRWSQIEAVVGTDDRLSSVAGDIVEHFEKRLDDMDGKGMIVCMSRRIAAHLYREIIALRPEWHSTDDDQGVIKVVFTGNAGDKPELRPHIRNKRRNEAIKQRMRDLADPLRLVIVRDMWLTGFDCPCLHTLYVDKPMKGHTLMQAIARVNRVFKDKPGGLVVDYIGLGESLRRAIRDYTASKGRDEPVLDIDMAVVALQEKLQVCRDLLHGFDYSGYRSPNPAERLRALNGANDYIEGVEGGRTRILKESGLLLQAFRLAGASPGALILRDEVAFMLAVRDRLNRLSSTREAQANELDFKVGQIVSRAVLSGGVKDIFVEVGLRHPDVSLVDDRFLQEVQELPHRNLAAAALERLLRDEIDLRLKRNVAVQRRFSERLDAVIRRYHNRTIEAAQVVAELVEMARELRDSALRGKRLQLDDDELAFYDALATNGSAVELMADETLRAMARELATTIRGSVTVDWALKESARAALRLGVKRLLRRYRYPPDRQEAATQLVLQQAEILGDEWASSAPPPALPRLVTQKEAEPYIRHLPVLTLEAAAGRFLANRPVEEAGWVAVPGRRLAEGMFVAQVRGRSMEPRIPNGAWCVFRAPLPAGSRFGKVVLATLREASDPEDGGAYTVKVYRSRKEASDDGEWRHSSIRLDSLNPTIPSIDVQSDEDVAIVAELVDVLSP